VATLLAILALIPAMAIDVQPVAADTQYVYFNGVYIGYGRTYQNNYRSSCYWYDGTPSGSPCYQGIWSDTNLAQYGQVRLNEFAEHHDWSCYDYYGVTCDSFYNKLLPEYDQTGYTYLGTNGVHYYAGLFGGAYPVDVRGFARHYALSATPSWFWWTTSDGY
jgi:hypothetical protein